MTFNTYGDLRRQLASEGIKWTVNPALEDSKAIVRPPLGLLGKLPQADPAKRIDVTALVRANPTTNALLAQDLFERGVLTERPAVLGRSGALTSPAPAGGGGGGKTVVDWRNRFTWNWITNIRDQDPCEHCWIYASTALVEAMVRIEHCVWCSRSEGDYIEANKVTCGQCGNPADVLNWIASNGQCDLDCVALGRSRSRQPHRAVLEPASAEVRRRLERRPSVVCSPRQPRTAGRSRFRPTRRSATSTTRRRGSRTSGPWCSVSRSYSDFFGWSGNVPYVKSASATDEGGHVMLAVGFNDASDAGSSRTPGDPAGETPATA